MSTPADANGLSLYARNLIRCKARQIARRLACVGDQADVEQHLTLELLRRLPCYDPQRSNPDAFATLVVYRAVCNLLRKAGQEPGPEHLTPLDRTQQLGVEPASPAGNEQERVDLALDLNAMLEKLPEDLRALAEELKHSSLAEAARRRGVSRSTLQTQLRRLRQRFDDHGLAAYLPGSSPLDAPAG